MQPQGLAALMPQGQPAPQMNNPRLAAAMDVVTSDAEENILDPRTLAMLKYKDAIQAMQAADQMMAAAQPQPMPPTVAERTRLAAEQGIAGLAARLSPGVQQRGAQIAAQQGAGGLPQIAAPNMARMAGGGIVAFAPGGLTNPLPTNRMTDEEIEAALRQPRSAMGQTLIDIAEYAAENPLDAALIALTASGVGAPLATGVRGATAVGSKVLPRLYGATKSALSKALGTSTGRITTGLGGLALSNLPEGGEEEQTQEEKVVPQGQSWSVINAGRPQQDETPIEPVRQQPNLNVGIAAPSVPTNASLEKLRAMTEQGETAVSTAGERYRELTGLEAARAQRQAEQDRLRALQESRFSPEQERRRLLRAALAGGAQRGLGGFGMGYTAEEERIANERQLLQQQVIADMDKTISELKDLGAGQFEAEQAAQEMYGNQLRDLAALDQEVQIAEMRANLERELRREGYDREDSRLAATNSARIAEAFMESMDVDEGQILRAYMSALEAAQMRGVEDPHSEALASVMSAMEALDLSRPSQVRIVGEAAE